jgi:cation diffusion facilitator family transporter
VADGQHARVDGLTSLGVMFSTLRLCLGYPVADPLIGVLITMAIVRIAWLSGKSVLIRLVDGVDPQSVEKIAELATHEDGVLGVGDVRARWLGHRLHTEVNLKVSDHENVATAHEIADAVRRRLSESFRTWRGSSSPSFRGRLPVSQDGRSCSVRTSIQRTTRGRFNWQAFWGPANRQVKSTAL